MTREEWLKDRLEHAARYPQHHPGLKGRLEELTALSLDEVADLAAEDLAGGCQIGCWVTCGPPGKNSTPPT